jgi:hypothetical protein
LENPKVVKDEQRQRRIGAPLIDLAGLSADGGLDRQGEQANTLPTPLSTVRAASTSVSTI